MFVSGIDPGWASGALGVFAPGLTTLISGVPTMVRGGQVRLLARALGIHLEGVRERDERRSLTRDVDTLLGAFPAGTQGALRFDVQGLVAAIPWLVERPRGVVDALEVPMGPGRGRMEV